MAAEGELHGFLFLCNDENEQQCLRLARLGEMYMICPSTALFLFNYRTVTLHGIFTPAGPPGQDLIPGALNTSCAGRLSAQIRFDRTKINTRASAQGKDLPRAGPLTEDQVRDLKKLLGVKTPLSTKLNAATIRRPLPIATMPSAASAAAAPSSPFPSVSEHFSVEELAQRRIANDGNAYTKQEFRSFYGEASYTTKWEQATRAKRCMHLDRPAGCFYHNCVYNHGPPPKRPPQFFASSELTEVASAMASAPGSSTLTDCVVSVPGSGGGGIGSGGGGGGSGITTTFSSSSSRANAGPFSTSSSFPPALRRSAAAQAERVPTFGAVEAGDEAPAYVHWECSVCTFRNPGPHLACGACRTAQPDAPVWHHSLEAEAVLRGSLTSSNVATRAVPSTTSPTVAALFSSDSNRSNSTRSSANGTEEGAMRSLLESFGVDDDAITSLISMGCVTLDNLAKASDAVLSAHGIKKGPRLKVLEWAAAQQTSTSSSSGSIIGAQASASQGSGSAGASGAGSTRSDVQVSELNAQGSTEEVLLDAHLQLLLMQIGASSAEESLSIGGVLTVDALARCCDADLINLGMQHDARTKILTWRQANYPAFVATEGSGAAAAGPPGLDHNTSRADGGEDEGRNDSAAPLAALAELLIEVGIPENTWKSLAGVGIMNPADLLAASDEVLVAGGWKRGPRIKLARFKRKKAEAAPPASASASATATTSFFECTSHRGTAAIQETTSAPVKSQAETAAVEKATAKKQRKALAVTRKAAEKAAREREAEMIERAVYVEKAATEKAAAEKAAAEKKAAKEAAIELKSAAKIKASTEKKTASKMTTAEKAAADKGGAQETLLGLLSTKVVKNDFRLKKSKMIKKNGRWVNCNSSDHPSRVELSSKASSNSDEESMGIPTDWRKEEPAHEPVAGAAMMPTESEALSISSEATALLQEFGLSEMSGVLASAGVVSLEQIASGDADVVLEQQGVKKGPRLKLCKGAQGLALNVDNNASSSSGRVGTIVETTIESAIESILPEMQSSAVSQSSEITSRLADEARAPTSLMPLRLGVQSQVLRKGGELAEVMQIKRDFSMPSGVGVELRTSGIRCTVFTFEDFDKLRAVPSSTRLNICSATAKLSSNRDAEERLGSELAAGASDVETTKILAPPVVRSLAEWLEYFDILAKQRVWLHSIVRPQSGWRHPENWGGPSAIAEKKHPCDVWGVVDASILPHKPEDPSYIPPAPPPYIVWHRVNAETGIIDVSLPRAIDRSWALTDVEVVTWCDLCAYATPSPMLARALVQLGGCVAVPHSTLHDDNEPYIVLPSDFLQNMAAAIVPFAPHPGLKELRISKSYADVPFWGVNHDRVRSHLPRMQSLGISTVCSVDFRTNVPANTLGSDGEWHCHLCNQGRQCAAPLCVCSDDGFSVCVRCAAAWFAVQTGSTTWVVSSGKPDGPTELQVRFEAAAEAARLAAPTTGFADLDPSLLEGWHSGPWANGGSGADTSPYIVYAILAAVVGMTAPSAAETLKTQIAKHESKLTTVSTELQEAKRALSNASVEDARGITCTVCTYLNEPDNFGGGVVCSACGSPLPPPSSESLNGVVLTKENDFAEAVKAIENFKAELGTELEQLENVKKKAASGESVEHDGRSVGLEPFLNPGGAVDRYIWSLPFLLRRFSCGADEAVFDLDLGWEMLPVVPSLNTAPAPDNSSAMTDQPGTEVLTATIPLAVFAAHPVFTAIEELRAGANAPISSSPAPSLSTASLSTHLSVNQPLRRSYFSRAESLAAAVESCCWLGVEACLSAGASATLVSVPVAMKLLHACAHDGSGPAAGYGTSERFEVPPFSGMTPVGELADPSDDPLALPEGKDLELLRALLVADASANEDTEGEVPLVTALWLKRLDYLALIARYKPDPNLRDLVGDSPLHVAIYTDQLEAAAKLREMGQLDCNATNLKGDSPMSLVMKAEHGRLNAIVRQYNEQFKKYKKRQKAKAKEAAVAVESSQNVHVDDESRKLFAKPGENLPVLLPRTVLSSKGPTKTELMAQQLERIDALTNAFLLSPDTTESDAILQEAIVLGNKDSNDGDDETAVAVVQWDKSDSDIASFWPQDNGSDATPFSSLSSSPSSPKGLDTFESLVWEVELSDKVVRWFRRRAKRSSELCKLVVQRLRILASGRWSYPTNQKLLKGVPKDIHLYEAKIDAAKRILWEVAVTFSERRSANLAQEGQHAVFAEGIRVWAIVEDHDNISTEVDKVVLAHRRGSACFLKTPLASNVDPLKGAAKPGGFDALVTAAAAEEEEGNGQEGGDATGARKAAAALSALVLERGEAGPCTFLGVDGDFCALSSSVSLPSSSSAAGTKSSLAAKSDLVNSEQSHVHYPPASPEPNDYKLLKFYSVTGPTLRSLLNRSGKSDASLPFKVTSKEWAILQLDTPRAVLLLGRSGTGKTSCICYRLAHKWSQYWQSERTCFETPPDVLEWRQAHQQHLIEQQEQHNSLNLGAQIGQGKRLENGNLFAGEVSTNSSVDAPCHLRQIFLTRNPVLRGQVEDVTRSLCQAFSAKGDNPMENCHPHGQEASANEDDYGVVSGESEEGNINGLKEPSSGRRTEQPKGAFGIEQLQAVPNERFPLFLTGFELLCALDASLPGERFQESKLGGTSRNQGSHRSSSHSNVDSYLGVDEQERAALTELSDYFVGDDDVDGLDEGNDDDLTAEGATSSGGGAYSMSAAATSGRGTDGSLSVAREVTYQVFAKQLWPKMKIRDTTTTAAGSGNNKSSSPFEPALVWTEINSYIKGSVEFLKAHELADNLEEGASQRQARLKEAYLGLGRKRVSMAAAVRERVWELFLVYKKLKLELNLWDGGDLVLNLHRRFRQHGFSGILFHHVFVDEVQDFTQAELYLVLSLCRDPDQCFLAGDTAQTIARGVGFRFTDIKDIFHGMSRAVPDTFTLVHNYRSHRGVLSLAAAVVDVIYSYFPGAIDKLEPDQGLFPGPKPKLLLVDSISNLSALLLGHQRRDATMGSIEFGAQQVVLVRSDAVRSQMPKEFTDSVIVLTVFEAKGLEFDDVLLWNFFSDGPTDDEWRTVYSYWLAKKECKDVTDPSSSESSTNSGSLSSSSGPLAKVSLEEGTGEAAAEDNEFTESQVFVNEGAADVQAASDTAIALDDDFDAAVAAATGKTPVRPLDFDAEKHKVLESELKALYCAITRARVNVWIVDFDLKKRKPAFAWFAESSLCEVVQESDDGLLDTSSSASGSASSSSRSTPEEWLIRGAYFLEEASRQESKRGFYENAVTCFRRAEQPDLLAKAVAQLAEHDAKEAALQLSSKSGSSGGGAHRAERLKRTEVDHLFLEAAEKCLEAKLGREAAFCLVQGKDDQRAAALYRTEAARTGSKELYLRAAKCYTRLKRYDDSIELLWRGGYTAQAVRQAASERRFEVAARLLDLDQNANLSCLSTPSASSTVDVKVQIAVQQLSRLAAKDALTKGNRTQLLSFLRVLPVLEQVAFLQSAEDTSLAASGGSSSTTSTTSTTGSGTGTSESLPSDSTTTSNNESVGYLGEIIAVLTRAGMHAEAAAQCAAHGEHLRGAEVLRRANDRLLHQAAPVPAGPAGESGDAASSRSISNNSSSSDSSGIESAATAMMADRGPLLEAESYLRFIDEALGCAFPAFPESDNTAANGGAADSISSSEIDRGVQHFAKGAWAKTRMGQSGTLVGLANGGSTSTSRSCGLSRSTSDGANPGSWIVRLFDGTEVEVRSRDLTGLASRTGLKGLLQQVTQLLDQQSKDTTSTLSKLAAAISFAAAVSGEASLVSVDEVLPSTSVSESGASVGNGVGYGNEEEEQVDNLEEVREDDSTAAPSAAAKASAEEVLALVTWRRAQVLQYEAQLMPSGLAATAQLSKALEILAQLPDRIVAVASTANWMAALAVFGPRKKTHGSGGEGATSKGVRTEITTWAAPSLAQARAAIRSHACPAAVALARALVDNPLPPNSLVSSLSLVPSSTQHSSSATAGSTSAVVMGLVPESACAHLEAVLGLESALVGDPSASREFRRGHKLLSSWAPMAMSALSVKDTNASSSSPTDPWSPAPGRGRTHLAMPRSAARLSLSLWLACSTTAFLRADLPEKWPDHHTVAMMVADATNDSNIVDDAIEHVNSVELVRAAPPLSTLTLDEALAQAKLSRLDEEILVALRNEGIVNGEQLTAASEDVLSACGVKKGPYIKLKKWRANCANSAPAAPVDTATNGGIAAAVVATPSSVEASVPSAPADSSTVASQKQLSVHPQDSGTTAATVVEEAGQDGFDVVSIGWEESLASTLPARLAREALLESMMLPMRAERRDSGSCSAFLGVMPLQASTARSSGNATLAAVEAPSEAVVEPESVVAAAAAVCAGASTTACAERLLLAVTHLGHRTDDPSKFAKALSLLFDEGIGEEGAAVREFDTESTAMATTSWGGASGMVFVLCRALDRPWEECRHRSSLCVPLAGSRPKRKAKKASTMHLNYLAKKATGSFSSDELKLFKASVTAPVHDLDLCLLAWHVSGLRQVSHPTGGSFSHDFDVRLADLDGALRQPNAGHVPPTTVWHLWRNANVLFRGGYGGDGGERALLGGVHLMGTLIDRLTSATAASVQNRADSSRGCNNFAATPASRAFVLQRQASILMALGTMVDFSLDTREDTTVPFLWEASWRMKAPSLLPWSWVHAHLEDAPLQTVHKCLHKHPNHDTWPLPLRADRARSVLGCLEQLLVSLWPLDEDSYELEEAQELQNQLAACLRSEFLSLAWALWWEVQDTGAALVSAVRSCTNANRGSSLELQCASELLDFERVLVLVLTVIVNAHHLSNFMGPPLKGNEVAHEKCSDVELEFVLPESVLGVLVKSFRVAVQFWQEALLNASQVDHASNFAGSITATNATTTMWAELGSSPVGVGLKRSPEILALTDAFSCLASIADAQGAGLCELLPVCSTHSSMNPLDMTWELQLSHAFREKGFYGDNLVLSAMMGVIEDIEDEEIAHIKQLRNKLNAARENQMAHLDVLRATKEAKAESTTATPGAAATAAGAASTGCTLSANEFVLGAKDQVELFLATRDAQAVIDAFREWGTPVQVDTYSSPFVLQLMDLLCTKYKDEEIAATANLLVSLVNEDLLTNEGVASGLSKFCENLKDYVLDVPKAQLWMIDVISTLCMAQVLDLTWLASCGGLMAESWKLEKFFGFSTKFAVQVLGAIAKKSDVATAIGLGEVLDLRTKAEDAGALDALLREAGMGELADDFKAKDFKGDYKALLAMQERLSSPLVWRLQLSDASTFSLESAGDASVAVTVEAVTAAMAQAEIDGQEAPFGMRRATAARNHFIEDSTAAAVVEIERSSLVEQRSEAGRFLHRAVLVWYRARAKSKAKALQDHIASGSGSVTGHDGDSIAPVTKEERATQLLADLPAWPSSTHGCALCGFYWPKDVKAFLANAKQRFISLAERAFGPAPWAAAVSDVLWEAEPAKSTNNNSNKRRFLDHARTRNQAKTAASSSEISVPLSVALKAANALELTYQERCGISKVTSKFWNELRNYSGSTVFRLCQKLDATESALNAHHEAAIKGNRAGKGRAPRGGVGENQQSAASPANLDKEKKSLLAEVKRLHKESVTRTRGSHMSSPGHKHNYARWRTYSHAEQGLCAAVAHAQLFMHRLPPADVARAMPTLGVAIEYQLVLAARGRNYKALRSGNGKNGDKMVSTLNEGATHLHDLHAQTAADLDDSVYLWNGGNRGISGGENGAGAEAENESDNEEGDDDDGGFDGDYFTLAPAAASKRGGGKARSSTNIPASGNGEGDGEWITVGTKKTKRSKSSQKGRSRGGLVGKPRR